MYLQPKLKILFSGDFLCWKSRVENKINTFLQVIELEYVPDPANPFKLVSTGTTSYSNYVYFYSWEKLETPKNILSIGWMEKLQELIRRFFNLENFDLRTGILSMLKIYFNQFSENG
jgi:hypothetical protein